MTRSAPAPLRRASLGTIFLTVFLDLLGFGLVVPFLPGVARDMGANDFVATLVGASYSFMQFFFVPVWGRLSDRVGRRPVLLWSVAASALGMIFLAFAGNLAWLFAARIFSGIATANIAVAQAYIADVTPVESRSKGMGIIGMAFGLGFILGPFLGGELGHFVIWGRPGALAALAAAGLSTVNFVLAARYLPESIGARVPAEPSSELPAPSRLAAFRGAVRVPGVGAAIAINFLVVFWFAGMEQTFRLFTDDAFHMSVAGTGRVLGFVGLVAAVVQGGLIHSLTRAFGETRLVRVGAIVLAGAFAFLGYSPNLAGGSLPALFVASGLIAVGSGLCTPSLSSYVSQCAGPAAFGVTLGALQSASALARSIGPATGGIFYQLVGRSSPYYVGSVGMLFAAALAFTLKRRPRG